MMTILTILMAFVLSFYIGYSERRRKSEIEILHRIIKNQLDIVRALSTPDLTAEKLYEILGEDVDDDRQ